MSKKKDIHGELKRALFLILAVLPALLGFAGGTPSSLSFRLTAESEPYVESVTGWMVENTAAKLLGSSSVSPASPEEVRRYFAELARLPRSPSLDGDSTPGAAPLRAELDAEQPHVEAAIQREVASAALKAGLGFRSPGLSLFPPVFFRFQATPNLLVVSRRSRIEREATVLLKPMLSVRDEESIEAKTSGPDRSSLVTHIGGLGVYPSMVPESADPRWTIRTVAHEWTHQYLAFRPLGWRYALGDEEDSRMITLNETLAEMVGNELGDKVYAEYYPGQAESVPPAQSSRNTQFRSLMREIRTNVDQMLAAGKVQEAESYMQSSRDRLEAQGFYIRKLNQAYFAFYGSYAEDPSAAGAIGVEISDRTQSLRASSASFGDFVRKLSGIGSFQEFLKLTQG